MSMFKFKFTEKRNKKIHEKDTISNSSSGKVKEKGETTILIKSSSMKSSSLTYESSNEFSNTQSINSIDPITYLKKLEKIIKKNNWNELKRTCPNERKEITYPKLITNIVIYISSIFMFYQAYIKQKWDREFKIEYTVIIIVQALCTLMIQLAVNGVLGDTIGQYR
eukprot:jgi/Orpsp1_1/1191292/evm.model.d7180000084719.1